MKKEAARAPPKKLIMPKLSVQDQLSDLEAMDVGIAEGIFDKKQLGVIAEEVGGCARLPPRRTPGALARTRRS